VHLLLACFCALFLFTNNKSIGYKRYENVYLYHEWCKLNDKLNAYLLDIRKWNLDFACNVNDMICKYKIRIMDFCYIDDLE
jgi:hypothetical protein